MTSQTSSLAPYREFYPKNSKQFLDDFFTFLKFPSISTDPAYTKDVNACAEWLQRYLKDIGFETDIWPTSGHPVVFGQNLKAGSSKPTLLIYNHYDVQPVDPLDLWETPPFEPSVRGGNVYARGAQDNKGQCFYTLCALKALKEIRGEFPINIKIIIEGEEECGSKGITGILESRKAQLQADYLAIIDLGLHNKDTPTITLGTRGIVALELLLTGSKLDLHSGSHGGIAYNPNRALAEILASLYNENGSVAVPGFYDEVEEVPQKVLDNLVMDFDTEAYKETFGIDPTGGERHLPPFHRKWIRPTVEINGISGGYTGEGVKTVIPAQAKAKITCRLVPNMDPETTAGRVKEYLLSKVPQGIRGSVQILHGHGRAVRADAKSDVVKAFNKAYAEVFEKPCAYIFSGGSIPVATDLAKASNSSIIFMGMGLADDAIHAPNEHFGLDRLEKGFLVVARAIELLDIQSN